MLSRVQISNSHLHENAGTKLSPLRPAITAGQSLQALENAFWKDEMTETIRYPLFSIEQLGSRLQRLHAAENFQPIIFVIGLQL